MSYYEGSNWQAKKEDEKKPLYEKESIDHVADVIKEYNKQIKEYEKYCQSLEYIIRDIDLMIDFGDFTDTEKIKMIKKSIISFNDKFKTRL